MSALNALAVPNETSLRRRTLTQGALLVVKLLAKFISVLGVQDFVHNAQELIVVLKVGGFLSAF